MGFFDFFRKSNKQTDDSADKSNSNIAPSVPESQKKYYQPDEYYTTKVAKGTIFERTVVTFEQRKKTCIPSERGLYVAEILLLEYCTYGTYPEPKDGYPGLWWFQYGIRDVAEVLKSLEKRGFIQFCSPKNSVTSLKISELKELLQRYNASITGKKADLVARVQEIVSDEALLEMGVECKYELTKLGKMELSDNAYVPYMHKHPHTTTEDDRCGIQFNVWSINKTLGRGSKSNWKSVVDEIESRIIKEAEEQHKEFMKNIKSTDPEMYNVLKSQDEQLESINTAENKYKSDKNTDLLIDFWEHLWANGGVLFKGSYWHFRLADLYITQKRYDDAITFCQNIKKSKSDYAEKADRYIKKIKEKKNKSSKSDSMK